MRVGAVECPDTPNFIRRNREALPPPTQGSHSLRNRVRTSEERLPLEGKLAQRQLRLMRSKRSIITISWYDAVTFDLIRHAFGVTPSPGGEGIRTVPITNKTDSPMAFP